MVHRRHALGIVIALAGLNLAGLVVYALARPQRTKAVRSADTKVSALRAAGLAALDAGNYDEAVKSFTQAQALGDTSPDLPKLLRISRELLERHGQTGDAATRKAAAEAARKALEQ